MSCIKLFWHCAGGRVVCTGEHRRGERTLRYQRREPVHLLRQSVSPERHLKALAEQVRGQLAALVEGLG